MEFNSFPNNFHYVLKKDTSLKNTDPVIIAYNKLPNDPEIFN